MEKALTPPDPVKPDQSAKREIYSGFSNALSLGFEFVATVGILYLLGHWAFGTIGGVIGIILGWIGGLVRLYFRFEIESPLAAAVRQSAARNGGHE